MANRKISDLTALTAPATGDLLPIVDISEAAAADKNKKITIGELFASIPLGTAAAPSIAFEGDNTGIYSPGADQLASSTNGTERLRVTSTGLVGIGTSSPLGQLSIAASSLQLEINKSNSTTDNKRWIFSTDTTNLTLQCFTDAGGGGGNFFRFNRSSQQLQSFQGYQSGVAWFHVDNSTARVGIGTTGPDVNLVVSNGGTSSSASGGTLARVVGSGVSRLDIVGGNSNYSILELSRANLTAAGQVSYEHSTNSLYFSVNGAQEAVRIDSSKRLLIGTSTASAALGSLTAKMQVQGTNVFDTGIINALWESSTNPAQLQLVKSRGASIGTHTVVQNNDNLGRISFGGSDGTDFDISAWIQSDVDGTPGANDMPGRLVFSTTADGASSPTEALRITNDRVIAYNQPAPTSKSAAATLTITELKTGIIEYTGAVATLTVPTGTLMEGGFNGIYTNMAFEWSVINTGAGICTIGAGTAHTIVGSAAVAIGASARFVSRRTASLTFVSYRLS